MPKRIENAHPKAVATFSDAGTPTLLGDCGTGAIVDGGPGHYAVVFDVPVSATAYYRTHAL